jgi:geranylgeranyl reductase family protein
LVVDSNPSLWDVVVVGAGPIGGYAARMMAERGLNVLMLEEHLEIGKPFQCAGLVNPGAMKKVGLEHTILSDVFGARMYSPTGIEVKIGREGSVRTHVVCRKLFDEAVVRQGMQAGATLWLDSRPVDVEIDDQRVCLTVKRGDQIFNVESRLLVGADGAHSWVRRTLRMGRPKEMMIGFQIEVSGYIGESGYLDMYTGQDIAPGLFAWAIPNGRTHRIGVWSRPEDLGGRSCEQLVEYLMKDSQWSERFENCRENARFCGPLPCGLIQRPWKQRVLLLGDAAGLAKPTTGGGIGPGFEQVDLIIEDLCNAVNRNHLSEKNLKKVCKPIQSMRKRQDKSRALRNLFVTSCNDDELDSHFEIFSRPEVIDLINEEGDIEKPVPLGISLLRKVPDFRGLAFKAGIEMLKPR